MTEYSPCCLLLSKALRSLRLMPRLVCTVVISGLLMVSGVFLALWIDPPDMLKG